MVIKTTSAILIDAKDDYNLFKRNLCDKVDDAVIPAARDMLETAKANIKDEIEKWQDDLDTINTMLNEFEDIAEKSHALITSLDNI